MGCGVHSSSPCHTQHQLCPTLHPHRPVGAAVGDWESTEASGTQPLPSAPVLLSWATPAGSGGSGTMAGVAAGGRRSVEMGTPQDHDLFLWWRFHMPRLEWKWWKKFRRDRRSTSMPACRILSGKGGDEGEQVDRPGWGPWPAAASSQQMSSSSGKTTGEGTLEVGAGRGEGDSGEWGLHQQVVLFLHVHCHS